MIFEDQGKKVAEGKLAELVSELDRKTVEVSLHGDTLRLHGPDEALTPELVRRVERLTPALAEALKEGVVKTKEIGKHETPLSSLLSPMYVVMDVGDPDDSLVFTVPQTEEAMSWFRREGYPRTALLSVGRLSEMGIGTLEALRKVADVQPWKWCPDGPFDGELDVLVRGRQRDEAVFALVEWIRARNEAPPWMDEAEVETAIYEAAGRCLRTWERDA